MGRVNRYSLGGRGSDQVVSVLPFYSKHPSSNPAVSFNFAVKLLLKRLRINHKEAEISRREECYHSIYFDQ